MKDKLKSLTYITIATMLLAIGCDMNSGGGEGTDPTVDTLYIQKLLAGEPLSNGRFGEAISISSDGNTVLIGSNGNGPGYAYVFSYNGSSWIQTAKLTADDTKAGDAFGDSVSLSSDGKTALIGTSNYGSTTYIAGPGAAYIFTLSGTTWTQAAKLKTSDGATSSNFGYSVSLSSDGSIALVGAYGTLSSDGAAYIYNPSSPWSGEITETQKLEAVSPIKDGGFGYSVDLSSDGKTCLIGTEGTKPGKSYIFTQSGATWTQEAILEQSDGWSTTYANFGCSVSLSSDGNIALIGASKAFDDDLKQNGAAYVYTRSGTTWTEVAKLSSSDRAVDDYFGSSVSLSSDGSIALIGAKKDDGSGSAYIFKPSSWSGDLTETAKIPFVSGSSDDYFGGCVSLFPDGKTALVGAFEDDDIASDSGSVYYYQTAY